MVDEHGAPMMGAHGVPLVDEHGVPMMEVMMIPLHAIGKAEQRRGMLVECICLKVD